MAAAKALKLPDSARRSTNLPTPRAHQVSAASSQKSSSSRGAAGRTLTFVHVFTRRVRAWNEIEGEKKFRSWFQPQVMSLHSSPFLRLGFT